MCCISNLKKQKLAKVLTRNHKQSNKRPTVKFFLAEFQEEERMADRYFPNSMPEFVPEDPTLEQEIQRSDQIPEPGTEGSLTRLLATPYAALSEKLERAALDLKETIVVETWGLSRQKVYDFTLYSGVLGTALLLFKSFQVTKNGNDLSLCSLIVKACDSASFPSR